MIDLVLRSERVVLPDGIRPATVHVADGRIAAVAARDALPASTTVIDVGDAVLMPGVVDTHVHCNEPGRTEWEGFETATRAAAAGGVTTLVDMPLNSIPATTTAAALVAKRREAMSRAWIDLGFWGGVVPGNTGELAGLVAGGVRGFKCFLCPSGVDEFPMVDEAAVAPAMDELARLGVPLLVHAEVDGPIERATAALVGRDPRAYATYLASRPPAAEEEAIRLVVRQVRRSGARAHIVHHSAATALPIIAEARRDGLPLSAETCPHYLHFAAEDIADGATPWKCAPPIRDRHNQALLWQALGDGVLDLVASDHSPCSPALKAQERGDFAAAWGGISGLQLGLSVIWSEAQRRGFGIGEVVRWMCEAPARLAGLVGKKGVIARGADADLVVFRPEERWTVVPEQLAHRHKVTPYAGETVAGRVVSTYLRGQMVFDRGEWTGPRRGELL